MKKFLATVAAMTLATVAVVVVAAVAGVCPVISGPAIIAVNVAIVYAVS